MCQQQHRQRVVFFSRGTRCAPDPERPVPFAGVGFSGPLRKNAALQTFKSGRFAKKMGFIGANAIEHEYQFLRIRLHSPIVGRERLKFQSVKSFP